MKKFLCIVSILFALKGALLGFDGFYVGGALGGTVVRGDQSGSAIGTLGLGQTNIYPLDLSADLFSTDFSGMLYAGFGYHWKIFYSAVEVFGQYSRNSLHASRENITILPLDTAAESVFDTTHIKIGPWQYGIDWRPGLYLRPLTLVYGRLGVAFTQLSLKTDSRNSGSLPPAFNFPFNDSTHKHRGRIRLGGGIEQHIHPKLSLRADYIFTHYGKLHLAGSNSGLVAENFFTLQDSKDVKLHSHSLLLGLSYYFSCHPCLEKDASCCDPNFCGFYVGAGVGGAIIDGQNKLSLLNISPGPGAADIALHPNNTTAHMIKGNVRSTAFAGYSLQYNIKGLGVFTGLEAFAQYSPYPRTLNYSQAFINAFVPTLFTVTTTTCTKAKISPWQYGIDLRLGVLASPFTLVYGAIGTSAARVHERVHSRSTTLVPGVALNIPLSSHSTRATFRAGGGLECAFNTKWHLRVDYRYTDYGSFKLRGFQSLATGTNGLISLEVDSKIHPIDHAVTIGLSFYL